MRVTNASRVTTNGPQIYLFTAMIDGEKVEGGYIPAETASHFDGSVTSVVMINGRRMRIACTRPGVNGLCGTATPARK